MYYTHDSLQYFLWFFISLLKASIFENTHILTGTYLSLWKKTLNKTWKSFKKNLDLKEKAGKAVIKLEEIWHIFATSLH